MPFQTIPHILKQLFLSVLNQQVMTDSDSSYFIDNPKHNMIRDWKHCKITTKFT